MVSLREVQVDFASALRGGDVDAIARCVAANGLDPARRVGIYLNNVRETFLGTLEATFPVILRLAGRDWLRQAGRGYLREAPSRHGNLHYVGERFPAWLAGELADGPYEYFVDVARLEWAYQEVLVAAEPRTLDLAALAAVPAERYDALVLEPNPTLRLVESNWPLLALWRANRPDVAEPPTVALDAGASRVMLVRRADHVELRELPDGEFALARAISQSRPLTVALDCAVAADPDADATASLVRVLQLGAASGFALRDDALH